MPAFNVQAQRIWDAICHPQSSIVVFIGAPSGQPGVRAAAVPALKTFALAQKTSALAQKTFALRQNTFALAQKASAL
jgi:hypothetical protein